MDLKEASQVNGDLSIHWYYKSKAKLLISSIDKDKTKKVLDIGAGIGFFSKYLLKHTNVQEAICLDLGYSESEKESYAGKPIQFLRSLDNLKGVDLIVLMDVLEHVDDDLMLLKNFVDRAEVGTKFFITVPAFMFLWSTHDVFLEHKRRYNLKMLEDVVLKSGLKINKLGFFYGAIFPIVSLIRVLERIRGNVATSSMRDSNRFVNHLLVAVCRVELVLWRFNQLCGVSVVCVGQK